MSLIPGTTIEYETKRHDEITSAYSYAPYATCWNDYDLGVNNNPVIRWTYPNENIVTTEGSSEVYSDIVWIYDENNLYLQESVLINAQATDTLPVITKLDLQKYKLVIDSFLTTNATPTGVSSVTNIRSPGYTLQANEYIKDITYHWTDRDETEGPLDRIKPVLRVIVNGEVWYFYINVLFETYIRNIPNGGNKLDATNPYGANMPHDVLKTLFHSPAASSFTIPMPTLGHSFFCGGNTDYAVIFSNVTNSTNLLYTLASSVDCMLKIIATLGVYFEYDDTLYLGFMDSTGQTTGEYLTSEDWNKSAQYESTNINNFTEHKPPYVPPYSDEDNTDPISTVGAPFGTGLAHYYVSTVDSTVLSQISEAMSTWDIDTSKKDLYRNLISCKIIKPPAGIPASPSTFEIYGVKPQYQGSDITINEVTGNPSIIFGSYSIPRKFNDFRDYAPYSKAEIFIPYCGWCALPSHVIGLSVSVQYFTDVIAGTVKAVVYCNNNVVAEAAGVMAVDIPFAAENVGAKVAAATTGLLSYGQGALQASAGIGQAVVSKGKQGTKNVANGLATVIGAYNQLAMTANENWTEINGKSGDGCCLAGISTIIIKITRPKYGNFTAPYYVPEDFPHTVGFIAMKKTTPAACTGLIICDNVDTSGIEGATERERQLIKEYLESGIIVEHPE